MSIAAARRAFLRGRLNQSAAVRPPWSFGDVFTDRCTRCGDCAGACPEQIIVSGDGGFPEINFKLGGCTFCSACVDACSEDLFDVQAQPWTHSVEIGRECLTMHGVICRNCADACDAAALRFDPRQAIARPAIDADACTGCGACISTCPVAAISLREGPS